MDEHVTRVSKRKPSASEDLLAAKRARNYSDDGNMTIDTPTGVEWDRAIQRTIRNVVTIRYCQAYPFDTEPEQMGEATGFVVDAEKGYILTNRHVVSAGPFYGYCVFDNKEEVECQSVYRDPIHDFGFLRYNPSAITYTQLDGLDLTPQKAKVGVEIRVVGNDASESVSILSGFIGRIDRNAPDYGEGYNDFNTCYYQGNLTACGGASGSPAVCKDGTAVALLTGGRSDAASTIFFLPLDRPLRALQCIQQGKPVTRGDLQCQFWLRPFHECRHLGLTTQWEADIRREFPGENNMLVADIVLPGGPSHHNVKTGDILIKVNGQLLTQFLQLDDILDSSVGKCIKLHLQRLGKDIEVEIQVGDLHTITPDRFVTVAGATFHDLSYQRARLYTRAVEGVYLCKSAGSFQLGNNSCGWIIQAVDTKQVTDLKSFIDVMKGIPDKARVVVQCRQPDALHTLETKVITVDRHWQKEMMLAARNDTTGLWDFTDLGDPLPPVAPERQSASFITLKYMQNLEIARLVHSFVHISCTMPIRLDGFPVDNKVGMGVVFDAEMGLVLISRAVVPHKLCDITITIADSIIVPGEVLFLHPLQNYAVVQYDTSLVNAPVMSVRLSSEPLWQGAKTYFFGHNQNGRVVYSPTRVTDIISMTIAANPTAPRYRAMNIDAISIESKLGSSCQSGVLVSQNGTVQALWLLCQGKTTSCGRVTMNLGLGTPTLLPVTSDIRNGRLPKPRLLPVELVPVKMSMAVTMGVTREWIEKVTQADQSHRQLFMVRKLMARESGSLPGLLIESDIILTLNGKTCTTATDFDVMYTKDALDAVVVRDNTEIHLRVLTLCAKDIETDCAVSFCGATLQRPHLAVRQLISSLPSEVYVSDRTCGSPAELFDLDCTTFIIKVNDQPTPDLCAFIKAVREIKDNTVVKIDAARLNLAPYVITVKMNILYFPTKVWSMSKPGHGRCMSVKTPK